jgi:hypothetical protein
VDRSRIAGRAGLVIALAALAGVLVAIFVLVDVGPFADDDLTVEEFLAEGDDYCSQAHDEFLDLQNRPPRTPSDAAELTGALIEVAEEERDAIADLREPDELSAQVDRYLEARDQGIDLLHEGQEAAENADAGAYEAVQAELAATQLDPRRRIAEEIGFSECSKPLVSRERLRQESEAPDSIDLTAPPTVNNPPTGAP